MAKTFDYYEILEVSRDASAGEIKSAYRRLARRFHPDLNPNDAAAVEHFQKIQEAKEVLIDPESRRKYDTHGQEWRSAARQSAARGGRRDRRGQESGRGGSNDFDEFEFGGFRGAAGFDIFEELFSRRKSG